MTKAVLLLNLGTPSEPTAKGLREFYKYFFADPFVFDFNPVARWLLRNLIIIPFRAPRTAKDYQAIWMEEGSPLKVYADRMETALQRMFDDAGDDVRVFTGMSYSKPFIWDAMDAIRQEGIEDILVLPMYPQYSTATTASVFHEVDKQSKKWDRAPSIHYVQDLFAEPAFIRAWAGLIAKHLTPADFDHVIFSYHGVPEKTIKKHDPQDYCRFGECCNAITEANRQCYRAQCAATTRGVVQALGWSEGSYSMAFQSRLGPIPWLQPYLDEHILELVEQGKKRVAVVTPSFISDCLETIHEIGVEYHEEFMEAGGEQFQLVPNLNDDPEWFNSVHEIAKKHLTSLQVQN
jgi:ferrochelatase